MRVRQLIFRIAMLIGGFLAAVAAPAWAQKWTALGPEGGDVRALAVDPRDGRRVYLGAADGHVFASEDGGEHWALRGRIGERLDGVVQRMVVDSSAPQRLMAVVWHQDPAAGGGIFFSEDGARTWSLAGLAGEAARALEQSPSDSRVWLAGTRTGVFRSLDGGSTWARISPAGHAELRNFDSLAMDPRNPGVIYAGTYHLPWKTADGGKTWFPVHRGMIDDSDVMSIVVDASSPERVYASACSGIYRSENAAAQWTKIQGIPYSARRTHAIRIDPKRIGVLYAATTEGLWKTADGGTTWRRMTPQQWVVNDAQILDTGRLLLATESQGVLHSDDGGRSFAASNQGFPHHTALDFAVDPARPERILVQLATSPGTLAASDDAGRSWKPLDGPRQPAAIRHLYGTPRGWWAALAGGGIARWDEERRRWLPFGWTVRSSPAGKAVSVHAKSSAVIARLSAVVTGIAFVGERVFLATDRGLFAGDRRGRFSLVPIGKAPSALRGVWARKGGSELWVAARREIFRSTDSGRSWNRVSIPGNGDELMSLELVPRGNENFVFAATERAVYASRDGGKLWFQVGSGLPATRAEKVAAAGGHVAAAMSTGGLFLSEDGGLNWKRLASTPGARLFTGLAFSSAGDLIVASKEEGLYRVELAGSSVGSSSPAAEASKR